MNEQYEVPHCCPLCSVMQPPGVNFTNAQLKGAFRPVRLWVGRRSGKFWLHRPTGCAHLPEVAGMRDVPSAIGQWNTWALTAAEKRAEEFAMTPERRAWWLYWIGCGPLPDKLLT